MSKRILAALALTAPSGTAFAITFEKVDANQDGMIFAEEGAAVGWTEEQIQRADTNADGGLDTEEFKAATGTE
jgi:hypothetical protein